MAGCIRCVVKKERGKEEQEMEKGGWGSKASLLQVLAQVFSYA